VSQESHPLRALQAKALPTVESILRGTEHALTIFKANAANDLIIFLRPTLMRTPLVKRQTTPRSGFFLFSALFQCQRSRHPASCPDFISLARCR
jgi:hypothetical protein